MSINLFFCQDIPLRGPFNQPSNGVIDGVVIKEELPTRSIVPYQSVRAADYVWSRRLYSRIDAREKMNQILFLPFDSFDGTTDGSFYKPTKMEEVDDYSWNKDQSRWSLWTIIFRHVLLGDLTVYKVASDAYPALEDGYSLKYPIIQKPNLNRSDYFNDPSYRKEINGIISSNGVGEYLRLPKVSDPLDTFDIIKTNQTAQEYIDSMVLSDSDYALLSGLDKDKFKFWWDAANPSSILRKDPKILYLASNSIFGYNIKEDWFFDKQRSLLDRRIISIAPLVRYSVDLTSNLSERGDLLVYNKEGKSFKYENGEFIEYTDNYEEREVFWLYFPELRNVIVNYFVYNDKSDAQWMSFDDLFWKRQFNAQIYKSSDKFDREIEDYKYGVDALYEAERIKDEVRKWEIDVWNY
ncbi:MAG: hypothetical protein EBR41_04500 [Crocinitomicaceae bacterium]|nr:hypothetical protein [Crocinitomicaceae bacterium]